MSDEELELVLEEDDGEKEPRRKRQKKENGEEKLELYDWVECLVFALVFGILFFIFGARLVNVYGTSMYPTLHHNDKIITTNLFYKPKPKDVVVVQTNNYGPDPLVKRIIAVGGQTVDIDFDAGIVYVDGVPQDEPYTRELTKRRLDFKGEVTVPEGCVFLMGDNRNNSTDSRDEDIGMVDERCISGKVIFILLPAREKGEKGFDWSRLGTVYCG